MNSHISYLEIIGCYLKFYQMTIHKLRRQDFLIFFTPFIGKIGFCYPNIYFVNPLCPLPNFNFLIKVDKVWEGNGNSQYFIIIFQRTFKLTCIWIKMFQLTFWKVHVGFHGPSHCSVWALMWPKNWNKLATLITMLKVKFIAFLIIPL